MASIKLGENLITANGNKVYFIAEIGQNHQGDLNTAKNLIKAAKLANADCVKFQKSDLESKFTKGALARQYLSENAFGSTYGEHKKYLELSVESYRVLKVFCKELEIDFTASAMDPVSLKFLDSLDVPFIKIGSGDANNFPLLEEASKLQKPLIISTGMLSMESIQRIVGIMEKACKDNFALMHCISAYPTHPEDCNLLMIKKLCSMFPNILIGYSGHELGIEISKAAILLGARIIERHFTLDKTTKGSDHKCSLEPEELTKLIADTRLWRDSGRLDKPCNTPEEVLSAMGGGHTADILSALSPVENKEILECEWPCKRKLGKSIVTSRSLKRGHQLTEENVCIKVSEPPGIFGEFYDKVIGETINCDLEADEPIQLDYFDKELLL